MPAEADAQLRDVSTLIASMAAAVRLENKELLRSLVDATKRRPDSPLASAVGAALEEALEQHDLLAKIPRG